MPVMLPRAAGAQSFKRGGQELEHGRRIAATAGRFAEGQAEFALSHRQPRQAVQQQQYIHAASHGNTPPS